MNIRREYLVVAALVAAALLSMIVWEMLGENELTPVPDAFRKAFDNGGN